MNGELGGSIPIAASEVAQSWDTLYIFLFWVSIAFCVIVFGSMLWFAIQYRQRPGHKATYITHHTLLEVVWTVVPTILVVGIFVWGWVVYKDMVEAPADAYEVRVIGKRWDWTFQYEDGRTSVNELYVPVNTPIKLLITAQRADVLHSFFIPNFRVKKDAVPGRFSYVYFKPNIIGSHQVFCTEYCGTSHSAMLAKVYVVSQEDFDRWWAGEKIEIPPPVGIGDIQYASASGAVLSGEVQKPKMDLVQVGEQLTKTKGCVACHNATGEKLIGPTYKGLWGSEVELTDGTKVIADENYIKTSIEMPQKQIVKGYEGVVMPPYAGQFTAEELNAVIAYMKSVK